MVVVTVATVVTVAVIVAHAEIVLLLVGRTALLLRVALAPTTLRARMIVASGITTVVTAPGAQWTATVMSRTRDARKMTMR